jgi:hypothetical protein
MRGAVYDLQTYMQLARIEAVSRNRECRLVLNTSTRTVAIFDGNGTSTTTDDTMLYRRQLPSSVSFSRPDAGSAVGLSQIDASSNYQAKFSSDGTVTLGSGSVCVFGGDMYGRVSIYAAGGTLVERWDGSNWQVGS